ncbi:OTU domain-containing protein 6B [Trichinella murrelli]|uniref:OTU domain-containing protein 6B n=1 Tax=Trichinella murrelli TaxID=144512 RepID=A0A0V0TWR4_9BILA|nr:OTU domain-containing protein 6B [Trichinella murrelli]
MEHQECICPAADDEHLNTGNNEGVDIRVEEMNASTEGQNDVQIGLPQSTEVVADASQVEDDIYENVQKRNRTECKEEISKIQDEIEAKKDDNGNVIEPEAVFNNVQQLFDDNVMQWVFCNYCINVVLFKAVSLNCDSPKQLYPCRVQPPRKAKYACTPILAAQISEMNHFKSLIRSRKNHVPSKRELETLDVRKILKSRQLKRVRIPGDGDCLYSAIKHQLSLRGIVTDVKELRLQASNIIRENGEYFMPYLSDHESDNQLVADQLEEYCKQVQTEGVWGGHPELMALSMYFCVPVEVIQRGAPSILVGEQFIGKANPLVIVYMRYAYQVGPHYDSTSPRVMDTSRDSVDCYS